jgi:outer membrane protein assembly factor BamB
LFSYSGFPKKGWHIPSASILPDGRIFLTGGYGAGSVMLKLEPEGDGFKVVELWKNKNLASKTGQPLIYKGYIYANNSDAGGELRCLTLDGEIKWDSAKSGDRFGLGDILIADDLIFIMNGDSGLVVMADAKPDGYKKLGEVSRLTAGEDWAPLVLSGTKLLIRDQRQMVCLDLSAAQ